MTGADDDARNVRADCHIDESTGTQLANDGVLFDQVQTENSVIGFFLLVKIAAIESMLDGRLTRADTQVFGMILSGLNPTTRTAWPSYELIARGTGVSEGQVKRSITNLRQLGYVISKRAGLAGSAHWLVHYGVGPIVNLRTIEMQIAQALSQLRKRPIDGFSKVDRTSFAPTASAKNSSSSGPRLVANMGSKRSEIDAVGWAKGGENVPLGSMPKGGTIAPVGDPRGAALRRLPNPTGAISAHSKTYLLTEDSKSQLVSARATDDARSSWLIVSVDRVRAELPGTTASVVRTITSSSIQRCAEILGVTIEQATGEIVEQFTIWRDKGFCGNNEGWEG